VVQEYFSLVQIRTVASGEWLSVNMSWICCTTAPQQIEVMEFGLHAKSRKDVADQACLCFAGGICILCAGRRAPANCNLVAKCV